MSLTVAQPLGWDREDASLPASAPWPGLARRAAGWLLFGGLALVAVALIGRRLAGQLATPLPAEGMLLTGGLLALIVAGARMALSDADRYYAGKLAVALVISALLLASGLAISLPASSGWSLACLWICVIAEEMWAWTRWLRERRPAPVSDQPQPDAIPSPATEVSEEQGTLLQQLVRRRTANGTEIAAGWLRVDFVPGQRTEIAHVSFCPPFATAPRVALRQKAGPSARIKDSQRLPYGLRLEVKLAADAAAATSVEVEFSAEG